MTEPALHHVDCPDPAGGHRMAYWQWGGGSAHLVVCVHGLTRQGRDFDALAQALVARAGGQLRVVCPDVVGRGQSDWLRDPAGYQLPTYAADMLALLAQLHAEQPIGMFDVVGTSMGGLIGMALAGQRKLPLPVPVRRLVINDVGPTLSVAGVAAHRRAMSASAAACVAAAGGRRHVGDFQQLRSAHAGAMAGAVASYGGAGQPAFAGWWRKTVAPAAAGGRLVLHYDPAIAMPFRAITPESAAQGEAATVGALRRDRGATRC